MKLQEKAELLSKEVFLGGPVRFFEMAGRLQLITLLREGLYPSSKVVDIGCGCLRGGYWLIHFLDSQCYCGIEPNVKMLEVGKTQILESGILERKQPRFDTNDRFDTSVFGEKFNFFLARSVWTHASKSQIQKMLDSFVQNASNDGVFLTSYLPAKFLRHTDYQGEEWIGKSHQSSKAGLVYHKFPWIQRECSARNLTVKTLDRDILNNQIWLKVQKT